MTGFWARWMQVWCWATLGFGIVLAGGAFAATDAGARLVYDALAWPVDGQGSFSEELRFTCGLLGAVMIGWAMTIFALVALDDVAGRRVWLPLTGAVLVWYVIDSAISIATGHALNAASNTVFLVTYLAPVLGSGVLRDPGQQGTARAQSHVRSA